MSDLDCAAYWALDFARIQGTGAPTLAKGVPRDALWRGAVLAGIPRALQRLTPAPDARPIVFVPPAPRRR